MTGPGWALLAVAWLLTAAVMTLSIWCLLRLDTVTSHAVQLLDGVGQLLGVETSAGPGLRDRVPGLAEFHLCRHCGEPIAEGTRGWIHDRTRIPACEDRQFPGSWSGQLAEPVPPAPPDTAPLRLAVDEAGVLVVCRNCLLPIEQASGHWQHAGSRSVGCWAGGAYTEDLRGKVAEPARRCADCGREESPGDPLIGTAIFATGTIRPVSWYCRDLPACQARRADAAVAP